MEQSSRIFRIFVSSTFSDLKIERNALQQYVFPRLRDLAMAHDYRFQAIDLRWGVSEEATLDQQTMKICLNEIKHCQKTSPKLNFIFLLGDRYGWQPLPFEIPADEFEQIRSRVSKEEKVLLDQWYRIDKNAVLDNNLPGVYCLLARQTELSYIPDEAFKVLIADPGLGPEQCEILDRWYQAESSTASLSFQYFGKVSSSRAVCVLHPTKDQYSDSEKIERSKAAQIAESFFWQGIEARLHAILVKVTADFPVETQRKYAASATEQEIVAGALHVGGKKNVFGFFRSFSNLWEIKKNPQNPQARKFIDYDANNHFDENANKRLNWLKNEIIDHLPGNTDQFQAVWHEGGLWDEKDVKLPDTLQGCREMGEEGQTIATFCDAVYARLAKVIESEAGQVQTKDEQQLHDEFAKERAKFFVGRNDLLTSIADYLVGNDTHPLVIWGASGSGKSALMAKAIEQAKESGQHVIFRFIGVTPDSSIGRALLEDLCRQISRRYEKSEYFLPTKYTYLVQEFLQNLAFATTEKPQSFFWMPLTSYQIQITAII